MDYQLLYKLADKFVREQEVTLRAIAKARPAPAADLAIREHLRAIEGTLDRIGLDGPSIPLDRLGKVRV
jgi:hypothetical protein